MVDQETDYRKYDRVWQRVAPELDPYPQARRAAEAGKREDVPARQDQRGDELEHILTQERILYHAYLRCCRCAGDLYARRVMQKLAQEALRCARHLMSAYYILTGSCPPKPSAGREEGLAWCEYLRYLYQKETKSAAHCRTAARQEKEPRLQEYYENLAREKEKRTAALLELLERSMLA